MRSGSGCGGSDSSIGWPKWAHSRPMEEHFVGASYGQSGLSPVAKIRRKSLTSATDFRDRNSSGASSGGDLAQSFGVLRKLDVVRQRQTLSDAWAAPEGPFPYAGSSFSGFRNGTPKGWK
jgi:hypothetical protein